MPLSNRSWQGSRPLSNPGSRQEPLKRFNPYRTPILVKGGRDNSGVLRVSCIAALYFRRGASFLTEENSSEQYVGIRYFIRLYGLFGYFCACSMLPDDMYIWPIWHTNGLRSGYRLPVASVAPVKSPCFLSICAVKNNSMTRRGCWSNLYRVYPPLFGGCAVCVDRDQKNGARTDRTSF